MSAQSAQMQATSAVATTTVKPKEEKRLRGTGYEIGDSELRGRLRRDVRMGPLGRKCRETGVFRTRAEALTLRLEAVA